MPQAIEVLIVFPLVFSVFPWRNHAVHSLLLRLFDNGVAVVPLIRKQVLRLQSFNQVLSLAAIRTGTFRNNDSDWHTMRIHGQMYLCVEPPFVRLMPSLPPLAPAACG